MKLGGGKREGPLHHIYIEQEGTDTEIDIKFPFKPQKH